jgi:hypothetical protein
MSGLHGGLGSRSFQLDFHSKTKIMSKKYILAWGISMLFSMGIAQSNILQNGSFEGIWNISHYPGSNQRLNTNAPYYWKDYNNDSNAEIRWYTDSLWVPFTPNDPNPLIQTGFYRNQDFGAAQPWENGQDSMEVQQAREGKCYLGFDAKSDDETREGIQSKIDNCHLNSGIYSLNLWWSRVYYNDVETKVFLSLARNSDSRHYIFDNFKVPGYSYTSGQWNNFATDFEIKLNKNSHRDLKWFSVTGKTFGNSDPKHYMYFDDIRLFRQCDIDSACFNPTGQICPIFATPGPPGPPMVIKNIDNVDEIHVIIYNQMIQTLIDTTFFNPNGLPDFYFQPAILSGNVASGNYPYDVTLANKCGAVQYTGQFQVQAGIYDTLGPWIDSTANWSEVPKECCLHTLTLRDMEITGDVSYIVKDTIWITDGVTAAPGSDILIQAGQVVEMDSVEFDGTNTVVEILEAPCQGCRLLPPSSGGTAPDMAEIGTAGVITASRPLNRLEAQAVQNPTSEAPNFLGIETEIEGDFLTGLSAYPNPFTNKITLEVELSKSGSVSLTVFDLSMRTVNKAAIGEILAEGIHSFQVDLSRESSGIYFVQLVANGQTFTEKVVKQ